MPSQRTLNQARIFGSGPSLFLGGGGGSRIPYWKSQEELIGVTLHGCMAQAGEGLQRSGRVFQMIILFPPFHAPGTGWRHTSDC